MNILIVGHGGCGKDTVAEMLSSKSGIPYLGSTSWHMKRHVARAFGTCDMLAWETRRDNRVAWRAAIDQYRAGDPARILREMYAESGGGIVTGVRPVVELEAARRYLHLVVWVDRPGIPDDPTCEIRAHHCDTVIRNVGSLEDLAFAVGVLAATLREPPQDVDIGACYVPQGEDSRLRSEIARTETRLRKLRERLAEEVKRLQDAGRRKSFTEESSLAS